MFSFKDIIGQKELTRRLLLQVKEQRVPHATLLCGPSGSGKMALALAYARYLCCEHRGADDACGVCPSCVKWNKLVHPDVHFVFPIVNKAKSPAVSVCNDYLPAWRQMLIDSSYFYFDEWLNRMEADNKQAQIFAKESDEVMRKLSLKSSQGGYKITLVWLPEKMNEACANKLLKLLEEPPALTLFILVSEAPEQMLTTILSRTQRINVPPLTEAEVAEALQTRYSIEPADSHTLAHMANGDFVKALEAIHLSDEKQQFFDLFVKLMRLSYQRKIREMKQWSDDLAAMGRERQKSFLDYCQRMVRENFVYNLHRSEMTYMNSQEQNFATRFAPFINERNVIDLMNELSEAQLHIEQNVNAKMVFFDFSLKMIVLLKQ